MLVSMLETQEYKKKEVWEEIMCKSLRMTHEWPKTT